MKNAAAVERDVFQKWLKELKAKPGARGAMSLPPNFRPR